MTVGMPSRVELPMPPGDPEALADLVQDVSGVAYWLTVLGQRLSGPAASAPGWIGDDAAAAAGQIGRVATLTRDAANAVLEATGRLSAHAGCLREARREVTHLRQEQDEDFRAAWRRVGRIEDLQLAVMTGAPAWVGVIEDVAAAEASRRRRHAALLEEVEDDAAATARVLAEACGVVGGTGARGDAGRVVAYLAAELPGWGDLELARRGRALAQDLLDPRDPEEKNALAQAVLPFAGSAAFADALLADLGPVWTREILMQLGEGSYDPDSALARTMALAFGAAVAGGGSDSAEVLSARFVAERDQDALHDLVVLGMGTVLAASLQLGPRGLAPTTVASWGRQIAAREHATGARAVDRVSPLDDAPPVDALPLVVAILADRSDPRAAATFLTGSGVWDTVLARAWDDCGVSLRHLVAAAGQVEGLMGESVVRGGLEAMAARLDDGDASDWPVHRATANAVTSALAEGIAVHPSLVGEALTSSADGEVAGTDGALLRGLGFVTLDRSDAAVIETALQQWVTAQPVPEWVAGPPPVLPAVVVPNAYLAVQQYGQDLAYSLNEIESKREADDRAFLWNLTVGLATTLAPGPYGVAAGVVEGYVAMWLGFDGTWDPGPHDGPTFQPDVPEASSLTGLTPEEWTVVDRMARQAEGAYEEAARALGHVGTPRPPETHWWEPILDAMPGPADAGDLARVERRHSVPD
jgi:hypothetical protein